MTINPAAAELQALQLKLEDAVGEMLLHAAEIVDEPHGTPFRSMVQIWIARRRDDAGNCVLAIRRILAKQGAI